MTLLKKLLLPTLIVLFPAAVLAGQSSFEAKVVKIIDGDTITALDGQNTSIKIRIAGGERDDKPASFTENCT